MAKKKTTRKKAAKKPATGTRKQAAKKKAPKSSDSKAKTGRSLARAHVNKKSPADGLTVVQRKMINRLGIHGNVSQACEDVGTGRSTHYNAMRENPAYAKAYKVALKIAAERVDYAIHDRAVNGVPRFLVHGGQQVLQTHDEEGNLLDKPKPIIVREYSDTLLQARARALMPDKYGKQAMELTGKNGGPIQHEQKLDLRKLTSEELIEAERLGLKLAGDDIPDDEA